ncbi:MAG: hypothetical protein IPJ03_17220 [Ignavibacteriales bacterium]|nr:hypothetical protein [Ignavibacteriales bacterium]
MSEAKDHAETVSVGLGIITQNRHDVAAWAQAVSSGGRYCRGSENLILAKDIAAKMERVVAAIKELIYYEENR